MELWSFAMSDRRKCGDRDRWVELYHDINHKFINGVRVKAIIGQTDIPRSEPTLSPKIGHRARFRSCKQQFCDLRHMWDRWWAFEVVDDASGYVRPRDWWGRTYPKMYMVLVKQSRSRVTIKSVLESAPPQSYIVASWPCPCQHSFSGRNTSGASNSV